MTMTERQIINLIEITLNEKMEQNENFIRYSFYEVNIKYCLKGNEIEQFVNLLKTKLVNNKYKVYLEGQKFEYNNANMTVQDNEILIAIKEEKYKKQSIDRFLFIKGDMLDKLKSENIKTLGQLSNKTRTDLKNFGFENFEINKIDIELQLLGLGLK